MIGYFAPQLSATTMLYGSDITSHHITWRRRTQASGTSVSEK